jgi:hypothetical protein
MLDLIILRFSKNMAMLFTMQRLKSGAKRSRIVMDCVVKSRLIGIHQQVHNVSNKNVVKHSKTAQRLIINLVLTGLIVIVLRVKKEPMEKIVSVVRIVPMVVTDLVGTRDQDGVKNILVADSVDLDAKLNLLRINNHLRVVIYFLNTTKLSQSVNNES